MKSHKTIKKCFKTTLGKVSEFEALIINTSWHHVNNLSEGVNRVNLIDTGPFKQTDALVGGGGQIYQPLRFLSLSSFFNTFQIFLKKHLNMDKIAKQHSPIFINKYFMRILICFFGNHGLSLISQICFVKIMNFQFWKFIKIYLIVIIV